MAIGRYPDADKIHLGPPLDVVRRRGLRSAGEGRDRPQRVHADLHGERGLRALHLHVQGRTVQWKEPIDPATSAIGGATAMEAGSAVTAHSTGSTTLEITAEYPKMQASVLSLWRRHRLVLGLCTALASAVVWQAWIVLSSSRLSFLRDAQRARSVVFELAAAQERCRKLEGRYIGVERLGANGCGGLHWMDSRATRSGFRISMAATTTTYRIWLQPEPGGGLLSYVADEEGRVHVDVKNGSR